MAASGSPSTPSQSGFIVVDRMLEDWEIEQLGFGEPYGSHEEALEVILREIHPAYRGSYMVREVREGKLLS